MGLLDGVKEKRAELLALDAARRERDANPVERWEYKVIRVKDDWQKGYAGSRSMQLMFGKLGSLGWELVALEKERAVFKRRVVSLGADERAELAGITVDDE